MGFDNPIVGGTALRIPAIQSPDYAPGSAGWIIRINGSAEFNDLTLRGEFLGAAFIINSAGIFLYDGTPAAGNLTGSWASTGGTDEFGNSYGTGLTLYDVVNGSQINLAVGGGSAAQSFTPPAAAGVSWQPATIAAAISNVFGANTAEVSIAGAYNQAHVSRPAINMFGSSSSQTNNRVDITTQQCNVSGELTAGNMDEGTATATLSAAVSVDVAISFSKTFAAAPVVVASIDGVGSGSSALIVRTFNRTTTGFTARVSNVVGAAVTSTVNVAWHARL